MFTKLTQPIVNINVLLDRVQTITTIINARTAQLEIIVKDVDLDLISDLMMDLRDAIYVIQIISGRIQLVFQDV